MKLRNERDRAKKDRKKERKRDKKDKKDKSRESNDKKHGHKKRHREERSQLDKRSTGHPKTREDEVEHLEKSSLTEERGPPSNQYTSDSPDSLQKINKRRKHDATDVTQNSFGSGLCIRLSSVKHKEVEPQFQKELTSVKCKEAEPLQRDQAFVKPKDAGPFARWEQPVLKKPGQLALQEQSVIKEPGQLALREQLCITKAAEQSVPVEQPCFSGRTEATPVQGETGPSCFDLSSFERYKGTSSSRRKEKKLQELIVNWNPPPIQTELMEDDDQDWLFGSTKRLHEHGQKRCPDESEASSTQRINLCSWPPRACYLKDADIYALPYVIPF